MLPWLFHLVPPADSRRPQAAHNLEPAHRRLHIKEFCYTLGISPQHFPLLKAQFVRDAHAYTVIPDEWKVLLSQRLRWINSTVHNLGRPDGQARFDGRLPV